MVRDITALFRRQAGLVGVSGLVVLAEGSDSDGRGHYLGMGVG